MLSKRIIPCLDVKDGRTVKGVHFEQLRDVGDAVDLGRHYALQGADELVYLDISASQEGRSTFTRLVERVADAIHIPLTVGGGISSLDDAARLLDAGADKVSINSAALARPELIDEIASRYGSQFVVVAIDARHEPLANDDEEAEALLAQLRTEQGAQSRTLLRRAGVYTVGVRQGSFQRLLDAGAVAPLWESSTALYVLTDLSLYDEAALGLRADVSTGQAVVF